MFPLLQPFEQPLLRVGLSILVHGCGLLSVVKVADSLNIWVTTIEYTYREINLGHDLSAQIKTIVDRPKPIGPLLYIESQFEYRKINTEPPTQVRLAIRMINTEPPT